MRAYEIVSGKGLDGLRRTERKLRAPDDHEVRLRMHAVSLNYRDLMITSGTYPITSEVAPIAVADGAGEVIAVGSRVTRFRVGDRVTGIYFSRWLDGDADPEKLAIVPGASSDGFLADEAVMHEDFLVSTPDHLDFNEAATLSCAGVTAWNALFVEGRAKPGNTVLLLGTGGVSIWALKLAKAAGLRTIITSSSDEKLERARALGADIAINYRTTPEWQDEVLRRTDGRGVDLVVEVGGHGTLNRSIAATRTSGIIVVIGGLNGFATEIEIMPLLVGAKRLAGIAVGSRSMFEDFVRFVTERRIRPTIDRIFKFDQAREAYAYLETAQHFGKVVIEVAGTPAVH
ncbi:MAG: zinc-binding dehydrogenase family protein [Verrucomicrobia bacterium]|nr:zinc-binding dehydrogenase family protein [Verrucomicrobiota bacterium]